MRAQQLDAGDRLQLPRSLVQHQLDVRERLEPGAEARLRLADALRDRPDPAAALGVEVEDPVGLGEAHRPQHDRLRLVGLPGHGPSVEAAPGYPCADVLRYTRSGEDSDVHDPLVRVLRARKGAPRRLGLEYEEVHLDDDPAFRARLHELTGGWTVPQILIDDRPIGGYTELWRLDREGRLDALLAA